MNHSDGSSHALLLCYGGVSLNILASFSNSAVKYKRTTPLWMTCVRTHAYKWDLLREEWPAKSDLHCGGGGGGGTLLDLTTLLKHSKAHLYYCNSIVSSWEHQSVCHRIEWSLPSFHSACVSGLLVVRGKKRSAALRYSRETKTTGRKTNMGPSIRRGSRIHPGRDCPPQSKRAGRYVGKPAIARMNFKNS